MRNRRRIFNIAHFNAGGSQSTNCRLASGARPAYPDFDRAHTMVARHIGGVRGGLLRGKRSTLPGPAETQRARTFPGKHVPRRIANGHDRVIERSLDVHDAEWDVLALLLLEGFLLAFFIFIRRRCAACSLLVLP